MTKVEKDFDTSKGSIKVSLFRGGVGWSIVGDIPTIFTWGLDTWYLNLLKLPPLEQIGLAQKYNEWCAEAGCNSCGAHTSSLCPGLQPIPMSHCVDNQEVIVNMYTAKFDKEQVKEKTWNEIALIMHTGTVCKPKHW